VPTSKKGKIKITFFTQQTKQKSVGARKVGYVPGGGKKNFFTGGTRFPSPSPKSCRQGKALQHALNPNGRKRE